MNKICIVYTHHKLGDLIWQLPYIKAISQHHQTNIDLVVREKTQAQNILKDLKHINQIFYNDFRKGLFYWVDVFKLIKVFKSCLLYTSPSPRDKRQSRMPSSA